MSDGMAAEPGLAGAFAVKAAAALSLEERVA
jgi:hypothetical protein